MDRVRRLIHTEETCRQGYSGKHVRVALLDTGAAAHPDLEGRIAVFRDFVNGREQMYDDNGHGTHVAGIICGSGAASRGRYAGVAPQAELIVLKVLDADGNGSTDIAIRALKWIEEYREAYHIRLLNFSMGYMPGIGRERQQMLLHAVDGLWDAGIAVVSAAGNNGPGRGTVTVPGISRNVITVGAGDDRMYRSRHLGYGYSGCGPTECCIVKPEILAPGTNIRSLDAQTGGYTVKSGTSMAAPVVCGALALALEKEPMLSPAIIKLQLFESVDREPAEFFQNCWGFLNVDNLLKML